MRPFDGTLDFYYSDLPHWAVQSGRYFITLRQFGSLPADTTARIRRLRWRWEAEGPAATRDRLRRHIFRVMETALDPGSHNQLLTRPAVADMVMEAMAHREQHQRWTVLAFVVMPNHLHLFVDLVNQQGPKGSMKRVLTDFKRWTGQRAKALTGCGPHPFWQGEWFDHWSRTDREDARIIEYIRNNPCRAGLCRQPEDWPWSSWSERWVALRSGSGGTESSR